MKRGLKKFVTAAMATAVMLGAFAAAKVDVKAVYPDVYVNTGKGIVNYYQVAGETTIFEVPTVEEIVALVKKYNGQDISAKSIEGFSTSLSFFTFSQDEPGHEGETWVPQKDMKYTVVNDHLFIDSTECGNLKLKYKAVYALNVLLKDNDNNTFTVHLGSSNTESGYFGVTVTEGLNLTWMYDNGKYYWYENNIRQGTSTDSKCFSYDGTLRGREIYDPGSDGWYWLDVNADGAKAVGKEVFMPYIYQEEDSWNSETIKQNAAASGVGADGNTENADLAEQVENAIKNKTGKWVRYDNNGKMMKGWVTIQGELAAIYPNQSGNVYYYDRKTGLMAKGKTVIDGKNYYFDEITGVLK